MVTLEPVLDLPSEELSSGHDGTPELLVGESSWPVVATLVDCYELPITERPQHAQVLQAVRLERHVGREVSRGQRLETRTISELDVHLQVVRDSVFSKHVVEGDARNGNSAVPPASLTRHRVEGTVMVVG